jgi:hypothetical protein
MDFLKARPQLLGTRLASGDPLADYQGCGSELAEQPQPITRTEARRRELPIDGGVREQPRRGGTSERRGERGADRRSPCREGRGHEVAVEPLVAAFHERRSALVEADEDRIDAGSGGEVAALERVQHPDREPRRDEQRSERHVGSARKSPRGLALQDEIRVAWGRLRVRELSHEVGRDVERRVRHDDVVRTRKAAGEDVAFAHDDPRHVVEAPAKATHEGGVAFDRDHARPSASQRYGESARTRTEVVDNVARTKPREGDELRCEMRIGELVLGSPELTSRSG